MKLNKEQRYALAIWLGTKITGLFINSSVVEDFDSFCSEDIREWRIIYNFGLAGKIWNVNDEIYITGYSCYEIDKKGYKKQQKIINEWNDEIKKLLATYA